jgi:hypothetical protein
MVAELGRMAARSRLDMLVYILSLARMEAESVARRAHGGE